MHCIYKFKFIRGNFIGHCKYHDLFYVIKWRILIIHGIIYLGTRNREREREEVLICQYIIAGIYYITVDIFTFEHFKSTF